MDNQILTNPINYEHSPESIKLPEGVSIWELSKFPAKTKPPGFSPAKLKQVFDTYAETKTNLTDILKSVGVPMHGYYSILGRWPEIDRYRAACEIAHSRILADETQTIADDRTYDLDATGRGNNAAVKRSELMVKQRQWMVERLNPREFGPPTQKVESTNKNLNINADAGKVDLSSLLSGDIGSVASAHNGIFRDK